MVNAKSPQCAKCPLKPCANDPEAEKPAFCPMVVYPGIVEGSMRGIRMSLLEVSTATLLLLRRRGMGSGLGLGRLLSFVEGLVLGGLVLLSVSV